MRNPTTLGEQQICIDIGWGIGRVCASLNPLVEAILAEEVLAA
jgi:hypothetical protein